MSIINDMLKDLDTQRVQGNTAGDSVLQGLGLSGDINTATQKTLFVVIAASVLVILAVFFWTHTTDSFTHIGNPGAAITGNKITVSARRIPEGLHIARHAQKAPARLLPETAPRRMDTPDITVSTVVKNKAENAQAGGVSISPAAEPVRESVTQTVKSTQIVKHQPSVQEHAQRKHRQALSAIRGEQHGSAETLLKEALALDNTRHETRLLLANLYIHQQRIIDAESILANGLRQYPGHTAYARLYAQLLVTQSRYDEALHQLQDALPGAMRDAGFRALLAGLYQRTGRALDAARHYQAALQLTPARGEWWMGLGISLEQSGNHANAHAAYKRALQYPLGSALQQYVNTRINSLPR